MKKLLILTYLVFVITTLHAQEKAKYFVFAYCQKTINLVCGEKVMIKQEEVLLAPNEVDDYENKTEQKIRETYNSSAGYNDVTIRLIPPAKAFICYEGVKIYDTKTDGWNCTSTFYGIEIANDLVSAEKEFEAMKSKHKRIQYKEIKIRDADNIQGVKLNSELIINGVSVNLKKVVKDGSTKVWLAEITNPYKDKTAILFFLVDGVLYPSDIEKPFKLQPGESLNLNLGKAAEISPVVGIKEKEEVENEGFVKEIKNYIRQNVKENNGKLEIGKIVPFSVRG